MATCDLVAHLGGKAPEWKLCGWERASYHDLAEVGLVERMALPALARLWLKVGSTMGGHAVYRLSPEMMANRPWEVADPDADEASSKGQGSKAAHGIYSAARDAWDRQLETARLEEPREIGYIPLSTSDLA